MLKFENEEVLVSYDDYGITLTSHRLICKTKNKTQEFMVKDLVGFTFNYRVNLKYFIPGTVVLLTAFFFSSRSNTNIYIITALFIVLYFFTLTKFLKILGQHTSIEFKVQGFKKEDLATFLSLISLASENRNKDNP